MQTDHEITGLLKAWSDGDGEALDALFPLVFDDLHRMACYFFQRERENHTLQPTALINELYISLQGQKKRDWECREDFINFAAEVMRHMLVNSVRRRVTQKRGAGVSHVPLDSSIGLPFEMDVDLIALDEAIEELCEVDQRQGQIVKLRFFLGFKVKEIAEIFGISVSTVKREWRTAKLWLRRRLKDFQASSSTK